MNTNGIFSEANNRKICRNISSGWESQDKIDEDDDVDTKADAVNEVDEGFEVNGRTRMSGSGGSL